MRKRKEGQERQGRKNRNGATGTVGRLFSLKTEFLSSVPCSFFPSFPVLSKRFYEEGEFFTFYFPFTDPLF